MDQSTRIKFNPLINFDASTLTGSYIAFGSFTYPCRVMHIVNDSNEDVFISFDGGTTAHLFIKAGSYILYDFGTNRGAQAPALDLPPSGMVIKGAAGVGNIFCMSASAFTPTQDIPGV